MVRAVDITRGSIMKKLEERKMKIVNAGVLMGFLLVTFSHAQAAAIQWESSVGGNEHFYEAVAAQGPISWTDARDAAILAGGYLATITSSAENAFVFDLANSSLYWVTALGNSQGPWIGGIQTNPEAVPAAAWSWVTGEEWMFTNWDNFEPNDAGGRSEYLHFHRNNGGGIPFDTWNDNIDSPGTVIGYVIEYDANPVPIPSAIWLLGTVIGLLSSLRLDRNRLTTGTRKRWRQISLGT